ncbi:MAG: error-prone DNA polymerase [Alphaproteobacteria bacterium]
MTVAELAVTSNFSFLRGASHPDELIYAAKAAGLDAVGLADRNTAAGLVRAHKAAKEVGIRFLPGVRLVTMDGLEVIAYPRDRAAYGRLTRLLTLGNARAPKGECHLFLEDILAHAEGQVLIVLPPADLSDPAFPMALARLRDAAPDHCYLALSVLYTGADRRRLVRLEALAARAGVAMLATNDVHYHTPERRPLQDVLTAIREGTTVAEAGRRLFANAERHVKGPLDMTRLFAGREDALRAARRIVKACQFSLSDLSYEYPDETCVPGETPQDSLVRFTWEGAAERFPDGVPAHIRERLDDELSLIEDLSYAPYFLTVYDVVRFARLEGILCQGRGSAANSVVCYCLGITAVDPTRIDLLFERFVSAERNEPPDIDVDFEHNRREEVIQYIYDKYGRDRAGIAATVITYRARSAVRDVGKALGLSLDMVAALSGTVWGWSSEGVKADHIRELGLDPEDRTLGLAMDLTRQLIGFPRHLSQHVGGFVITRGPLTEVVPVVNAAMPDRTFVEWDKDDLDALGMLKIDILALGMLTCIGKAFDLLRRRYDLAHDLASVPPEDPAVYDMLCRADTVGVFQVESRAQMSMLPRLKPRAFYDLVIEVAIVRPGPIQGDMVHPYLRRRAGREEVSFPSRELEQVLGKTLGVPLFQEQAMRIAIVAGGFSPSEADRLRRAMATFRKVGIIHEFGLRLVDGMVENGYERDFAERCFRQIEGFGEYGFPESHAASFALLVYISSWLKCHYPDVFLAAILNAQPLGFYAPAQLVRDAREHGVIVRPVDVNHSLWDADLEPLSGEGAPFVPAVCTREGGNLCAVRLGFRSVKGLNEDTAKTITGAREQLGRPFDSVRQLWLATGLAPGVLECLADADAFASLGLDRRAALWAVRALDGAPLPLFNALHTAEPEIDLPPMPMGEQVIHDYARLRLSLRAHPLGLLRSVFTARKAVTASTLKALSSGAKVTVAGLVLVRQRPGSAKGVIFITLEDETGIANVVVWPKIFERFRRTVLASRLLLVRGKIQREGTVIHVVSADLVDCTAELGRLAADPAERSDPAGAGTADRTGLVEPRNGLLPTFTDGALAPADEVKRPGEDPRGLSAVKRQMAEDRTARILPRSRDFH